MPSKRSTTARLKKPSAEALGLVRAPKRQRVPPDSLLSLAGFYRTGSGSLLFTGRLRDRPLAVFQHQFQIYAGYASVPVVQTVYVVEVSPHWPHLNITRRGSWSWLSRLIGHDSGLRLESEPFNRAFRVTAEHEDFAIALLSPEMQTFLHTKTNVTWKIDTGRLALFYSGKLREDRLGKSLERLRGFLDHIPEELEAWGM